MPHTRKALATRRRIVTNAAELMDLHGFSRCRLEAILAASSLQKGNFYYYFRSKDDLGLSVLIEVFMPRAQDWLLGLLAETDPPGGLDGFVERLTVAVAAARDPLSSLLCLQAELGAASEALRERIVGTQRAMALETGNALLELTNASADGPATLASGMYLLNTLGAWLTWFQLSRDAAELSRGVRCALRGLDPAELSSPATP